MTEIPPSSSWPTTDAAAAASLSFWTNNTVVAALTAVLSQFIDIDYSSWVWRFLWPLIVTFLLPLVFVMLIYLSSLFLYIYKLHRLVEYLFIFIYFMMYSVGTIMQQINIYSSPICAYLTYDYVVYRMTTRISSSSSSYVRM